MHQNAVVQSTVWKYSGKNGELQIVTVLYPVELLLVLNTLEAREKEIDVKAKYDHMILSSADFRLLRWDCPDKELQL